MAKRKMTIEDLAIVINRGFNQTVTKEEFRQTVVTKEELRKEITGIKSELKELKGQIDRLAADVYRLREEVRRDDPFVEDLLRRMRMVEKRIGIVK